MKSRYMSNAMNKEQTLTLMKADMKVYVFIKPPHGLQLQPQAQIILKAIEEDKAITRPALITKLDARIETSQMVSAVLAHHAFVLEKHGLIKIMKLDEYMARQKSAGVKEPVVQLVENDRGGWSIDIDGQQLGNYPTKLDAERTMINSCLNEKK